MPRKSSYIPEFCQRIEQALAQGYSITAACAEIGISKPTVYKWAKEYDEFSDALDSGKAKALLFWEKRNIEFASSGQGNATSIIFALKNRAPDEWGDKRQIEKNLEIGQSTGNLQIELVPKLTVDEAIKAYKELIKK